MYFVLDRTFRNETLNILRWNQKNSTTLQVFCSGTGSATPKSEQQKEETAVCGTVECSHASVI